MTKRERATQADHILDALGDGTRRALLGLLAQSPASVSDLARVLEVTKTAIGQHITILEACQLVTTQKSGRVRLCQIDHRGLDVLQDWIKTQRRSWDASLGRLGEVLGKGD